jgi:hypothetical protein
VRWRLGDRGDSGAEWAAARGLGALSEKPGEPRPRSPGDAPLGRIR